MAKNIACPVEQKGDLERKMESFTQHGTTRNTANTVGTIGEWNNSQKEVIAFSPAGVDLPVLRIRDAGTADK